MSQAREDAQLLVCLRWLSLREYPISDEMHDRVRRVTESYDRYTVANALVLKMDQVDFRAVSVGRRVRTACTK